jgi:hypothetical protein
VIALCARQHHQHRRDGGYLPASAPPEQTTRWLPVVRPPEPETSGAFVALAGPSAVAFVPITTRPGILDINRELFQAVRLSELSVSDLVGSWDGLSARGQILGEVRGDAIRFDPSRKLLDCQHLTSRSSAIPWETEMSLTTQVEPSTQPIAALDEPLHRLTSHLYQARAHAAAGWGSSGANLRIRAESRP